MNREIWRPRSVGVETERKPSIGVTTVIVGIDPSRNGENITSPKLWTVKEKKSKPATEKLAGQISFPAETRKNGEDVLTNTIGALVEFTDNPSVVKNLFMIGDKSHVEGRFAIAGNPIDVMVLIHEGPLWAKIKPADEEEVSPNGWMGIKEILEEDPLKVRSFTRDILIAELSERRIREVVSEYFRNPLKRVKVGSFLPQGFSSMRDFHNTREKSPDVIKGTNSQNQ